MSANPKEFNNAGTSNKTDKDKPTDELAKKNAARDQASPNPSLGSTPEIISLAGSPHNGSPAGGSPQPGGSPFISISPRIRTSGKDNLPLSSAEKDNTPPSTKSTTDTTEKNETAVPASTAVAASASGAGGAAPSASTAAAAAPNVAAPKVTATAVKLNNPPPPAQIKSGGITPVPKSSSPDSTLSTAAATTAAAALNTGGAGGAKAAADVSKASARRFSADGAWVTVSTDGAIDSQVTLGTADSGPHSKASTPASSARNTGDSPSPSTTTSTIVVTATVAAATATTAATAGTGDSSDKAAKDGASAAGKKSAGDLKGSSAGSGSESPDLVCVVVSNEEGKFLPVREKTSPPAVPVVKAFFKKGTGKDNEAILEHLDINDPKPASGHHSPTEATTAAAVTAGTNLQKSKSSETLRELGDSTTLKETGSGSSNEHSAEHSPHGSSTGHARSRSLLSRPSGIPPLSFGSPATTVTAAMSIFSLPPSNVSDPALNRKATGIENKSDSDKPATGQANIEVAEDIREIETQIADFKKEKERLTNVVSGIMEELSNYERKLKELLEKGSPTSKNSIASTTSHVVSTAASETQESEGDKQIAEIKELEIKIASKKKMILLWKHSIESCDMNIRIFTENKESLSKKDQPLLTPTEKSLTRKANEALTSEQTPAIDALSATLLKLGEEKRKLQENYDQLSREKNGISEAHAKLEATRAAQEKADAEHNQTLTQIRVDVARLQKEKDELSKERDLAASTRGLVEVRLTETQRHISELTARMSEVQTAYDRTTTERQNLHAQLTQRDSLLATMTSQLTERNTVLTERNAALAIREAEIRSKDEQIARHRTEITQLTTQRENNQRTRDAELDAARKAAAQKTREEIKAFQQKPD